MIRSALLSVLLVGCPLPDKDDADTGETGDADTDTDTDTDTDVDTGTDTSGGGSDVLIMWMNGGCGARTCTWEINATGELGTVTLSLIETGDPAFECLVECGVWAEEHDAFLTTDFDAESETKAIELALTEDPDAQTANVSTLFDVNERSTSNQLTVLFVVTDRDGNYADCATYGHMPEYFADVCTNNANEW